MLFRSWKRTAAFLLILFSVLLVLSWSDLRINQQPFVVWIQNVTLELVSPVQRQLERSFVWVRESISTIQELGSLRETNQRLQSENEELAKQVLVLAELRDENQRLHELLDYSTGFSAEYQLETMPARIIAAPSHWSSRYLLDVGSDRGLRVDMVAITPRGVVGKIVSVTPSSAELMLLQDELSGVGGRLKMSGGYLGIVHGQGSLDPTLLMTNISVDADIQPGDIVITSGLGGVYPPDLPIGTVISTEADSSGFYKSAKLQMTVDCYQLYEVLIVMDALEPVQVDDVQVAP